MQGCFNNGDFSTRAADILWEHHHFDDLQREPNSLTHQHDPSQQNRRCSHRWWISYGQDYYRMDAGRIPSHRFVLSFRLCANPSILWCFFLGSVDFVQQVARDNYDLCDVFSLAHSWGLTRLSLTENLGSAWMEKQVTTSWLKMSGWWEGEPERECNENSISLSSKCVERTSKKLLEASPYL